MISILHYCIPLTIGIFLTFGCESATAARLVKVRIYVDGTVILEGSFSVNGSDDADECWRSFQHGTERKKKWAAFRETTKFDGTRLIPDQSVADRFVLKARDKERISISVGYGGKADVKELILHRYTEKPSREKATKRRNQLAPRKWILDAKQLDELFGHRKISDRETARLKTPRKVE